MHNVSTLKPFMDPSLLQDLGSRIFQDASANIASNNLMVPQYESARGSLTYIEDRLQVKRLTVGLMATCLGLLVCISIQEVFVRPWDTVSCEPNSISALSTILAASRSLRQCLASTGSATLDNLQRRLSRYKFQTVIVQQQTSSFVLEPVSDFAEMAASPPSSSVVAKVERWRPTAVRTGLQRSLLCFHSSLSYFLKFSSTSPTVATVSLNSLIPRLILRSCRRTYQRLLR